MQTEGIELNDPPFGRNGAWAPEGGQPPVTGEDSEKRGEDSPTEETHFGKTQSTTNSQ